MSKKNQAGVEYMIIIGFVTLAVLSILALSTIYSNQTKDKIRLNQVESFGNQLINNAETVFFSGEPSEVTVNLYIPDGVSKIEIISNSLVMTTRTSSGTNIMSFDSMVPIQNVILSPTEGIKSLSIKAREEYVVIG